MPREIKPQQDVILSSRLGSWAYGLNTESSDTDVIGVYIDPPERFLGLHPPTEKQLTVDATSDDYDYAYHELGKYCRLAAKSNPTVTEVMWADEYIVKTTAGQMLVDNRQLFLSQRARSSFGGYVKHQAELLQRRQGDFGSDMKKRYSKNARHLWRLFREGRELLETGTMRLRVTPEEREEIFAVGELPWEELAKLYLSEDEKFQNVKSDLPLEPDEDAINELLLEIRGLHRYQIGS